MEETRLGFAVHARKKPTKSLIVMPFLSTLQCETYRRHSLELVDQDAAGFGILGNG